MTVEMIGDFIKEWWAWISAFAGICGLIYKTAILPFLRRRRAKEEERAERERKIIEALNAVKDELKELSVDVGVMQHHLLQTAHDEYMRLGWCPAHQKENLCMMYDRYISRGRNHLYKGYRDDITRLPEVPSGESWGVQ